MDALLGLVPLVAASMALALAGALAQGTAKPQTESHVITVQGCLQGMVLTTADDSPTNAAVHKLTLTGDKETLKQLKQLSNHLLEVTGVPKGGDDRTGARIAEKPIPKGRVYVAVGSAPVTAPSHAAPEAAGTATLDVKSFADIRNSCP